MAKRGRPKIEWTEEQYKSVEYMALIQCTQSEIANTMGVDEDTLNRLLKKRYKVRNFSEWFNKYSAGGKMSLRRLQFKSAERGNTSMLIWLGRQWLGQTDHPIVEDNIEDLSDIDKEIYGEKDISPKL